MILLLQELDTPGHETAIGLSHPEHVACYLASPWADFASGELVLSYVHHSDRISISSAGIVLEPPAGQLRLATPSTINFTTSLVASVAKNFRSSLFSTGGDEVNTNCYAQDNQTQTDLAESGLNLDEALDAFLHATHAVLTDMGKGQIVKEGELFGYGVLMKEGI